VAGRQVGVILLLSLAGISLEVRGARHMVGQYPFVVQHTYFFEIVPSCFVLPDLLHRSTSILSSGKATPAQQVLSFQQLTKSS
jgi:hypothetical protein